MGVRASTKQKVVAGPRLSGSAAGGYRKKRRCFYVATPLCYDVRRGGSSPQAFEPVELYHGERSQMQLLSGVFSPNTAVWELSVLPPKLLPLAVSGYQEQCDCPRSSPNVG